MSSNSAMLVRRLTSSAKAAVQSSDTSSKLAFLHRIKNVAATAAEAGAATPPPLAETALLRLQPKLFSPGQPLNGVPNDIVQEAHLDSRNVDHESDRSSLSPPISSSNSHEFADEALLRRLKCDASPARVVPSGASAAAGPIFRDLGTARPSLTSARQIHTKRSLTMVSAGNNRKAFFLDTLALVRRLEAEGLTAQQAEAITHVITDVLHETLDSASHTFVSNSEMQKSELVAEANMSKLKAELQSSIDVRLAKIQKEVETLNTDLDKVKSELRYEVDKVTAGQRLDLNLERGRVKEELNQHAQETSTLSNKMDREVAGIKAQLEAAKFEVIRYCVGTLVSVSAVGLGVLRVLM